jgi:TolB-like protein
MHRRNAAILLILLGLALGPPVHARQVAPELGAELGSMVERQARPAVVVLGFAANEPKPEHAEAVTALLASNLSDTPGLKVISDADLSTLLGLERQRELLGAGDGECKDACYDALASATGARYVVTGRIDRFGEKYVLTANLFDAHVSDTLSKPRAEADGPSELPGAVRRVAGSLRAVLDPLADQGGTASAGGGPQVATAGADGTRRPPLPEGVGEFSAGFKFGSGFLAELRGLNLGGDLELNYRFHREWFLFLQVGASLVHLNQETGSGRLTLLPGLLGARHLILPDNRLQPYWGLGLGIQLSLGEFITRTGALPNVLGLLGLQYLVTPRFSLGLEGSTNIAQTVLGLDSGGTAKGLNLDLYAALRYRF